MFPLPQGEGWGEGERPSESIEKTGSDPRHPHPRPLSRRTGEGRLWDGLLARLKSLFSGIRPQGAYSNDLPRKLPLFQKALEGRRQFVQSDETAKVHQAAQGPRVHLVAHLFENRNRVESGNNENTYPPRCNGNAQ